MTDQRQAAPASQGAQNDDPDRGAAGAREWAGLAVLTLPVLLVSMDMTVLHLAMPAITTDLQPSSTQLWWIVDVYAFLVAGLLITMGAVGDRIGRRRLLLIGAAAFAAASVAAAFATSPAALIAARAALGIAGATLAPSTLALIRTMFTDPRQRSTATSVWVLAFLAGAPGRLRPACDARPPVTAPRAATFHPRGTQWVLCRSDGVGHVPRAAGRAVVFC